MRSTQGARSGARYFAVLIALIFALGQGHWADAEDGDNSNQATTPAASQGATTTSENAEMQRLDPALVKVPQPIASPLAADGLATNSPATIVGSVAIPAITVPLSLAANAVKGVGAAVATAPTQNSSSLSGPSMTEVDREVNAVSGAWSAVGAARHWWRKAVDRFNSIVMPAPPVVETIPPVGDILNKVVMPAPPAVETVPPVAEQKPAETIFEPRATVSPAPVARAMARPRMMARAMMMRPRMMARAMRPANNVAAPLPPQSPLVNTPAPSATPGSFNKIKQLWARTKNRILPPFPVEAPLPVIEAKDDSWKDTIQSPPPQWDALRSSMRLTQEYLEDPKGEAENLGMIGSLNNLIIEQDNQSKNHAVAWRLINYMLGPALRDPKEHEPGGFFYNLAVVGDKLDDDKTGALYGQFRWDTDFDQLLGRIGQNKAENPEIFEGFHKLAASKNNKIEAWTRAYHDHASNFETFQKHYEKLSRAGRWAGYGLTAATLPISYLAISHVLPWLPPDLQWALVGGIAEKTHQHIEKWIDRLKEKNAPRWLHENLKAVRESFEDLYKLDPARTLPYLLSAATRRDVLDEYYRRPGENEKEQAAHKERMVPLEEMAISILMRHRDSTSTDGLIELGIRKLRNGEPDAALKIFTELAKRDPHGTMGKIYPSVTKAIEEAEGYDTFLKKLGRNLSVRKKMLLAVPAAAGMIALCHGLDGEALSTAVTIFREVFIGAIAAHLVGKIGHSMDSRPLKVATTKAEDDLFDAFAKLESLGPRGFDILKALAENKLPGESGIVIQQAAQRAIDATPGMQAAQQVMKYAAVAAVTSSPETAERETVKAGNMHRNVRNKLCELNFEKIGHYLPKVRVAK